VLKGSLVVSLLGMTLAVSAAAQPAVPTRTSAAPATATRLKGPIKITAERADLERKEYALYRGRVRLESNDMVMTGDRLELRQPDRGEFEARLTGTPARLDHRGDDKGAPPLTASAEQIVYDTRTATVDLSGGVQLARGTDVLNSGNVRYNAAARRITANGDGASQVHITITPPQNDEPEPKVEAPVPKPKPNKKSKR